MEAWRLADDMNDAIDDFILCMKCSNDGKRFMQAKIQPRPFQDLKRRAVDVCERCHNKWKTETSHTTFSSFFSRTKTTVDSGPGKRRTRVIDPYVHKDISELVRMENPRDMLIDHLVGEEENTPQLKMACIVGAAGMGKTTLARLVYEAIQDQFQAQAFVSVTSSRNMTELLVSILQQVTADSTDVLLAGTKASTKNKHLIGIISNFLKDKRYLVIIDDIWHYGEWETIKKSLPDNDLGSRIVTTSRLNAITERWRDDFDTLVHKFSHRNYGSEVQAMIDGEGFAPDHPIVDMCAGMPLAGACMMSVLAKEQEQQGQWCVLSTRDVQDRIFEQVTRNGIQNTPGFEPLVESLELGYNDLPHHMLKTCLLYCSIYPEYQNFKRDHWISRWIAEGFVCKEEAAKDYFEELVNRGFIIDDSLHPMMPNYLRCKLREHNFITCSSDIQSSPVGRLCIDHWSASNDAVDPLSGIDDWHHIRSLVVFEHAERVPYKHLENLRVLDVQCNPVLENQHLKDMCGLLRLRLLRLCGDGISKIPADIGRLKYLETLQVTETKITRLPAEIGDLKQLKTLEVTWNQELAELPREIGNLQHLERLRIHGTRIREQAWEIIGTLKKLKTLDVRENPELSWIPRDIGELQQLKNLDVSRNRGITELPKEIGKLLHLETLNVSGTGIKELPKEIGELQQLKTLNLNKAFGITKLPRDIGRLQNLEELNLLETKVRKMPREIGGLNKLKNLDAEIGTLPFEAGQLSKLEGLPKCVHKAWKNSDLVSSLAGKILSFQKSCYLIGDGGLVVGTKHMHIPRWIKEHFNRIGTLDIRICKLEEQDLKILREMPYLWDLTLRFEAVPRKTIVISSGGFAKLQILTVDCRVPRITFQEGAMPSLENLTFEFQFYGGPPNTDPPMGIKHLVSLEEVSFRCNQYYRGDIPCISTTIDVVTKELGWPASAESSEGSSEASSSGANEIEKIVVLRRPASAESSEGSSEASSSGANEIEEIVVLRRPASAESSEGSSGANEIEEIQA
ncbi:disease resistance protein Pikm1-TS-like isoform X2 [Miscanthus floridulus]|uniref:disease resistance protein Pikm1-TS-like isoform X2 n=1 Tax=Miscanthus floridulus TaxID=154761 RepID=UPI003459DA58